MIAESAGPTVSNATVRNLMEPTFVLLLRKHCRHYYSDVILVSILAHQVEIFYSTVGHSGI